MIRIFLARLFQRSSLLRLLIVPFLFAVFFLIFAGITLFTSFKPQLKSISPSIGEGGEVVMIQGSHFGIERGDNWVEIAGSRISSSAYLKWTDTTIMMLLPQTVEDGLVFVMNRYGKSNPLIFANRTSIPVAARAHSDSETPVIGSFDATNAETGTVLTISGKNFGITRNKSAVLFSWQIDPAIPMSGPAQRTNSSTIAASDHDFDYELWSDQEIKVRVPDGATSGSVYVRTDRGLSNPLGLQIANQRGTKKYVNRHTFVLSLQVDITGITASDGNILYLRIPVPEVSAAQRDVQITLSNPKPYMENYQGIILHQLENIHSGKNEIISHTLVLSNYGIATSLKASSFSPYADVNSPLYLMYTSPDRIIPSDSQKSILKAAEITGKEKNPYLRAKLIYNWILDNIALTPTDNPDRPVLDSLVSKTGDAYDFAVLFTTLARSAGIPALPVAGILADNQLNSKTHWWSEFYLEGFGWVPLDPGQAAAKAAAAEAAAALVETTTTTNPAGVAESPQAVRDSYFGSLDAYHIAFSRGWADQKPMTPNSKIVFKPRSFAFQPIWEESGGNIKGYTSFWADPKVTGIYQ